MNETDSAALREILIRQEELVRFSHFTARDAWEVGRFLTERAYEQGVALSICIRRLNGAVLFAHLMEGTTLDNQRWMDRKFRTVSLTEKSSLRVWAEAAGQTPEDRGLPAGEYAFCGGGFPIRLRTGELAAVATVSNLPHYRDHAFLTSGLAAYLGVEIPQPEERCFAE
jgi:uncharacterized protein (UPF0303 family)